jgi:hypothetical protein
MQFIQRGHTIRHKATRDLAFKVTTAIYGHSGDVIVFGKWLNNGFKRTQVIDNRECSYRISKEQQEDWVITLTADDIQPYVKGA